MELALTHHVRMALLARAHTDAHATTIGYEPRSCARHTNNTSIHPPKSIDRRAHNKAPHDEFTAPCMHARVRVNVEEQQLLLFFCVT